MKSEAPLVLGSLTNIPPRGAKELLEPGESRHQRGFQRCDERRYYEGRVSEGPRELMSNEKTKFDVWEEGQIQHGMGDQWSGYEFDGETISDEGPSREIGEMAGERGAIVGQPAACDTTTLSLEEWLDSTSSECLDTEYLEGSPPRSLLGVDAEAYIPGELEESFADMSPGIIGGGWTGDDIDESNGTQDFHQGFDVTGAGGLGESGVRTRYGGGRDCAYSCGVPDDDAGLHSIFDSADPSPDIFGSGFWRPNLRG